jgi:hypothetical protein
MTVVYFIISLTQTCTGGRYHILNDFECYNSDSLRNEFQVVFMRFLLHLSVVRILTSSVRRRNFIKAITIAMVFFSSGSSM